MGSHLHNELRKEFQLERLILFSDAVFAIAITLLVIEIKIPEIPPDQVSDRLLLHRLDELAPKFIGFLVSFILIGQYWIVHHRMFGYVINFTGRLIWLNIFFLFTVALMPFSTGFYSEYVMTGTITPVIFYTANIVLLGTISFLMWRYISNPKRDLSENLTPAMVRFFSVRSLSVPVLFVLFTVIYLFSPVVAFWLPPLIPLILNIAFRGLKKKALEASKELKL
ncbi:MAG: TMEM175 family protein [Chitinophagaceae bacterium]